MKRIKRIGVVILIVCLLSACTIQKQTEQSTEQNPKQNIEIANSRPSLLQNMPKDDKSGIIPCVEAYIVEPDLSNVKNVQQFYWLDGQVEKLAENGFVVCDNAGSEFFEIYEENRYSQVPNFVTVDSLMHTYHLYFSYLLRNIEKEYLSDNLTQLSRAMLEDSTAQYNLLKGSEWESAAARNVAFFTVGTKLLDSNTAVEDAVEDMVQYELDNINRADGISVSGITEDYEDYSQYIPRGCYEGNAALERYFQAMMWYGRIHFARDDEDMDRSALLMTQALMEDEKAYELWESVYVVTSFFAGASDDMGVCEYAPIMREAYGGNVSASDMIGDEAAFNRFRTTTVPLPQINSIPVEAGEDTVIPGFRFMGQRFTIDAALMQQLIYSKVKQNEEGMMRMLPDVLDVPAALGSDTALHILEENGETGYDGYTGNMEKLRKSLSEDNPTLWSASLYAGWLNTLRPLLEVKGEGYPVFMQSEEWAKKDLECFAGSFTELKHDTILYSKQVIAEMGGGYDERIDDRGYVQPEPLVYARFARLADWTARGLKEYGMLSASDGENLSRLSELADRLRTISEKELQEETLTEDEYDFLKSYGGNLEHFWYEAVKDENAEEVFSKEIPAAIVVDIATDPNGAVLEAATSNPALLYVVVRVDGKLKIARGSVYSFYQFAWPLSDRLTDSKWRQMMGLQADENGNYHYDTSMQKPDWTMSYRYEYNYEW